MRCRWPSCIDKTYRGLPICQTHANYVWRYVEDDAEARVFVAPEPPTERPKAHERQGWVYYVEVHGVLKIGFAKNVESRMKGYPPGSNLLAAKRGTMADEKAEHQRCTPWRVSGREWYALNDATRRVVQEARDEEAANVEADYQSRLYAQPPRPAALGRQPDVSHSVPFDPRYRRKIVPSHIPEP